MCSRSRAIHGASSFISLFHINICIHCPIMKVNEEARKAGLDGTKEVSEMTGCSRQTLNNWAKFKPKLLKIVIEGCRALKNSLTKT